MTDHLKIVFIPFMFTKKTVNSQQSTVNSQQSTKVMPVIVTVK